MAPKLSAIISDFYELLGGFFGECSVAFLSVSDGVDAFFVSDS